MVVELLERPRPAARRSSTRARPSAAATGRRTRPRRGAGRSRRPPAGPRGGATYTGASTRVEHVGQRVVLRRASRAPSAPATRSRPRRRTTCGDSAMKKPRSASTRRRSSGSVRPDVVGEPRIVGVVDHDHGAGGTEPAQQTSLHEASSFVPRGRARQKTLKIPPEYLHRVRRRVTMPPKLPRHQMPSPI